MAKYESSAHATPRSWLLLKKGDFRDSVMGPELRYLKLGEALSAKGHRVTIGGTKVPVSAGDHLFFIPVKKRIRLIREALRADVIILHGGGPLLFAIALLAGFRGKTILFDAYAPHWLELYSSQTTQSQPLPKALSKISVNLARLIVGALVFDHVIVANQRQLDLVRGVIAASGRLDALGRVHAIPFGCDVLSLKEDTGGRQSLSRLSRRPISSSDFLIGWLGGVWRWLDVTPVIQAIAELSQRYPHIKLLFFGLEEDVAQSIKRTYERFHGKDDSILFLPRINYRERLHVWSGLDASIVWARQTLENDYASRTRNYDCISIGLPIIQNHDEQWGRIIAQYGCGLVTDDDQLTEAIESVALSRTKLGRMAEKMRSMQELYSWAEISRAYINVVERGKLTTISRLLALATVLPQALIGVIQFLLMSLIARLQGAGAKR